MKIRKNVIIIGLLVAFVVTGITLFCSIINELQQLNTRIELTKETMKKRMYT